MLRKYAITWHTDGAAGRGKPGCEDRILSGECRIWMELLITYRTAENKI